MIWVVIAVLWCAPIAAVLTFRRRLTKTPAPGSPLVPGPSPVPGQDSRVRPPPIQRPAPAPGHTHHPSDRLLTARFFTDGCVDIWDATGNRTHRFETGDVDLDWDGWLDQISSDPPVACPGCGRPSGVWCEPSCEYAKGPE